MTQVWRLMFVVCDSLSILKRKRLRDVSDQCQPADGLIVFERRVLEAGETPWFIASFFHKYRHAPDSSHMHISPEEGWLLGVQSGRTGPEILFNLGWLPVSRRTECLWLSVPLSATVPLGCFDLACMHLHYLMIPNLTMHSRLNASCTCLVLIVLIRDQGLL